MNQNIYGIKVNEDTGVCSRSVNKSMIMGYFWSWKIVFIKNRRPFLRGLPAEFWLRKFVSKTSETMNVCSCSFCSFVGNEKLWWCMESSHHYIRHLSQCDEHLRETPPPQKKVLSSLQSQYNKLYSSCDNEKSCRLLTAWSHWQPWETKAFCDALCLLFVYRSAAAKALIQ